MKKSSQGIERRTRGRDTLFAGAGNDWMVGVRPWGFKCGAANDAEGRVAA